VQLCLAKKNTTFSASHFCDGCSPSKTSFWSPERRFPYRILILENQISKDFEPASKFFTHRLANILTNRVGIKQLSEELVLQIQLKREY
jgi:hypothetical protein